MFQTSYNAFIQNMVMHKNNFKDYVNLIFKVQIRHCYSISRNQAKLNTNHERGSPTQQQLINWTMNSWILVPNHVAAKSPTYNLDSSRILNPSSKRSDSILTANKFFFEEQNSLLQAVITNLSDPEIPYRQRKESVHVWLDLNSTQVQYRRGGGRGTQEITAGGVNQSSWQVHVSSWTNKGDEPRSRRRKRALVCTSSPA